jgi:uncharacterized membrane protein YeaQ/YmgE (transglycosylase-associated protein family)
MATKPVANGRNPRFLPLQRGKQRLEPGPSLRRNEEPTASLVRLVADPPPCAASGEATRSKAMGLILALIIGGIIGWLASIVMRTNAQQGILLNIVVGIVGSLLGSFLLGGFFGADGSIINSPLDGGTLLAAFVGAVILLAIVNLFRRGAVR